MTARVLFYIQHLLGIGHVKRAAAIARAMAARDDLAVTVALGGPPVPVAHFGDAEIAHLPQVFAADASFKPLLDEDGNPIDDAWRERRARALMDLYERVRPDVMMFEMFPFGRRQFRFELLPLLRAARQRADPPPVISSVRDVLVAKDKPERNDEMLDLARTWFDYVFVHGDPDLMTTRPRAVVAPFAEGEETEQAFRARLLAARGVFTMLESADLSAASLAAAIDAALDKEMSAVPEIDLSGAETTAALIAEIAGTEERRR